MPNERRLTAIRTSEAVAMVAAFVVYFCVYGFRTEADKMIGVEMLAGKTADPSFTTAFNMITPQETNANLAQVHSGLEAIHRCAGACHSRC